MKTSRKTRRTWSADTATLEGQKWEIHVCLNEQGAREATLMCIDEDPKFRGHRLHAGEVLRVYSSATCEDQARQEYEDWGVIAKVEEVFSQPKG